MPGEELSDHEREVTELTELYPGISVNREMSGFIDVAKAGDDGYTPVERLEVHPFLDGAVSVKSYTDLDAAGANGKVGADLEVTLIAGKESVVTIKQVEPGVDVDGVIQLAQQGFKLFDRYRALPKDARFKVPANKVHDDAHVGTVTALEQAGFDKGVARAMAGGEDESPEGQYRAMQPVIKAPYRIVM